MNPKSNNCDIKENHPSDCKVAKKKLNRTRKCLMLLKYPLFRSPLADLLIGRMQIPTFFKIIAWQNATLLGHGIFGHGIAPGRNQALRWGSRCARNSQDTLGQKRKPVKHLDNRDDAILWEDYPSSEAGLAEPSKLGFPFSRSRHSSSEVVVAARPPRQWLKWNRGAVVSVIVDVRGLSSSDVIINSHKKKLEDARKETLVQSCGL